MNTQKTRQSILIILDICIVSLGFLLSSYLTKVNITDKGIVFPLVINIFFNIGFSIIFRLYSSLWTNSVDNEIIIITVSSTVYLPLIVLINKLIGYEFSSIFYVINILFIILATISSRVVYRVIRRISFQTNLKKQSNYTKTLIIGGGSAGDIVISELYKNTQLRKLPIGIIDDDKNKLGRKIKNVEILGTCEEIPKIVKEYQVEEIIFSIAGIEGKRKQEIINICKETKCKLKTIPGIYEIIDGKVDMKKIRNVDVEDLLGREPVKINLNEISSYVEKKTILVTGGGGSIGSELCRQISKYNPNKLIILDIYENGAYEIQQELKRQYKQHQKLEVIIASVRDKKRLDKIFDKYKPEVVFHAAAHKHVPLMENSPSEAIKNNIFGTLNVVKMAHKHNAQRFVLISTDKAVNPTNIMGATKRCAEMIIQSYNEKSNTEFVAVRFGNVLGSNGSVIPLFKKQIEEGGPVIVTHPKITRYFMTIPEAVSLVMQAGAMAKGGEIFILNMGDSVKILDLAKNLISLSGFEVDKDIKIEFSGLRPGEKLYEELLMEEEGLKETHHNKIFIGQQIEIDEEKMYRHLHMLRKAVENEEIDLIEPLIKSLVPTFIREEQTEYEVAATV